MGIAYVRCRFERPRSPCYPPLTSLVHLPNQDNRNDRPCSYSLLSVARVIIPVVDPPAPSIRHPRVGAHGKSVHRRRAEFMFNDCIRDYEGVGRMRHSTISQDLYTHLAAARAAGSGPIGSKKGLCRQPDRAWRSVKKREARATQLSPLGFCSCRCRSDCPLF